MYVTLLGRKEEGECKALCTVQSPQSCDCEFMFVRSSAPFSLSTRPNCTCSLLKPVYCLSQPKCILSCLFSAHSRFSMLIMMCTSRHSRTLTLCELVAVFGLMISAGIIMTQTAIDMQRVKYIITAMKVSIHQYLVHFSLTPLYPYAATGTVYKTSVCMRKGIN